MKVTHLAVTQQCVPSQRGHSEGRRQAAHPQLEWQRWEAPLQQGLLPLRLFRCRLGLGPLFRSPAVGRAALSVQGNSQPQLLRLGNL